MIPKCIKPFQIKNSMKYINFAGNIKLKRILIAKMIRKRFLISLCIKSTRGHKQNKSAYVYVQ